MNRCEDCVHYAVCIKRRIYGRTENCKHFKACEKTPGCWLYDRYYGGYFCTVCGEYAVEFCKTASDNSELIVDFLSDYCPNCGVKMRKYPKDPEEQESFAEYLFSQGLTLGDLNGGCDNEHVNCL